jgi:oligoendopeptidase F
MQNELLFFELSLSTISPEKQSEFLSAPVLADYRHFLEKRFEEAKHLLTPEGEKILNILSKTSYENREAMTEKLIASKEVDSLTFETLADQCSDLDPEKRKRAGEQINIILASLADVAENELNSILEYKKEVDKLRNFTYPEQATYLRDDIDKDVVDAMSSAVTDSYDFSQQFYAFKAKLLGKDQLTYEEKNLKYGSVDKEYTFEEAVALVHETVQGLDPEF